LFCPILNLQGCKYGSDEKNNLFKDINIKSKPLEILIKICTVLNLHTNSLSESNITKDNIPLSKQDEMWKKYVPNWIENFLNKKRHFN